MQLYYYVDKHAGYNDNHVVHATGCPFLPSDGARRFLGTLHRHSRHSASTKILFQCAGMRALLPGGGKKKPDHST